MKRNLSIDILKLVMAFFVVALHGRLFNDFDNVSSYFFGHIFGRIAVPIFLLISGFYFYNVKTKNQYKKWIKRLFYLHMIWMIIYIYFWIRSGLRGVIISLVFGWGPLWYLIGTFYGIILIWIIRNWIIRKQLILLFCMAGIGLFLQYNWNYKIIDNDIIKILQSKSYANGLFFCFPFLYVGYLINKFSIHTMKMNWILLLILSFLLLCFEVSFNYICCNKGFGLYISHYSFCPILFVNIVSKKYLSNNKTLALYSTGVYLSHPLFGLCLAKFTSIGDTPLVFINFILSLLMSLFLIRMKKRFEYIL
jgi:surface polysaccharide O-acyltransferase-like enzyme